LQDLIEEKRGRRRRLTTNVIERQKRIAKAAHLPIDKPHRFAKHHATNCRTPNCICCGNPRRVWKEKTLQEKKADLWTKE
jgi:hypothetical protein